MAPAQAHLIRPRPKTGLMPADMAPMSAGMAQLQMDMAHLPMDRANLPTDTAQLPADMVHLPADRTHLPVGIATNTARSAAATIVLSAALGQTQ
jgi:hypothetical protein